MAKSEKSEKVERPTKKREYELRFASVQARRGWTDLKATIRHSTPRVKQIRGSPSSG
jgi:hypothetical protein